MSASSSRWLVSIMIGPVQDFIAAARKTRDLFYGSWLLSELSKACARRLMEGGARLIFPHSDNLETDLNNKDFAVVNKLLASLNASDETVVEEAVRQCRQAVRSRLETEYETMELRMLEWKLLGHNVHYDSGLARTQIPSVIEFYGAWEKIEASGYQAARDRVEQTMAARKALRDFEWHEGSNRPKSSLDGFRETVVEHGKREPDKFFLQTTELLDSIGLLKRMGRTQERAETDFDSTHDIAAASFVIKARKKIPETLSRYEQYAHRLDHDNVAPFGYSHIYRDEVEALKSDAKLQDILKPLRELNPIPPYYGLFIGDGDSMGKAISGLNEEEHKKFSNRLSGFANAARRKLSKPAQTIFAGGDDVMAFLPLHVALARIRAVRDAFNTEMDGFGVSFSAGLAVCHAMEPLTEVREWARMAEGEAKKTDGKDALCVTVVTRSGGMVTVTGKWKLVQDLESIAQLYVNGRLPLGLAHEFRLLLTHWKDATKETREKLDQRLPAMAAAIARKKEANEQAARLVQKFVQTSTPREDLEYLTRCLYVARPFSRSIREAEA